MAVAQLLVVRHHCTTMKIVSLLMLVSAMMALRVSAADTNFNQSITVQRPLDDVVRAMQTYYFSTNYHGFASAVFSTNLVPGVSYSLVLADCAFSGGVGLLGGDMVATRVTTSSTKLELIVRTPTPKDLGDTASFKRAVSRTLEQVEKIAEDRR